MCGVCARVRVALWRVGAARWPAGKGACALTARVAQPTRFKKSRTKRGHVSMGHGRIGKHRKHPSGRGNAGGQHHHRILFDKFHPGYFGKVGMRKFHLQKNRDYCPAVNVEELLSLLPAEDRAKALAAKKGDPAPIVDVTKFGYHKVLGKGHIKTPMVVKAKFFSQKAEQKLNAAGGVAELTGACAAACILFVCHWCLAFVWRVAALLGVWRVAMR